MRKKRVTTVPRFSLAGFDVDAFAHSWLDFLDTPAAASRGLLAEAGDDDMLGPVFMMANIGSRAVDVSATESEMIVYAVLAAYQNERYPDRPSWTRQGTRGHLDAAFAHATRLGRTGVAKNLLLSVLRFGRQDIGNSSSRSASSATGGHTARTAAHEQEMAHIANRDIRAAALLDPALSIDSLLLDENVDMPPRQS